MKRAGARFVGADLRRAEQNAVTAVDLQLAELKPQREVKRIQRRAAEGARDLEFRPVRPPLAPRKPTS